MADDCPRAPQGSTRVCRATEPHTWRPQGRGSRPPGWNTESWRCPGWARTRGGGHLHHYCRKPAAQGQTGGPRPETHQRQGAAGRHPGKWSLGPQLQQRAAEMAPTAPASGKGPDPVRAPVLCHTRSERELWAGAEDHRLPALHVITRGPQCRRPRHCGLESAGASGASPACLRGSPPPFCQTLTHPLRPQTSLPCAVDLTGNSL